MEQMRPLPNMMVCIPVVTTKNCLKFQFELIAIACLYINYLMFSNFLPSTHVLKEEIVEIHLEYC